MILWSKTIKFKELLDAYGGCNIKPFLNDDCFFILMIKKVLKEKYGEYKVVSF